MCLGNAVPPDCAEWIGYRILEAEAMAAGWTGFQAGGRF